MVAVLIDFMDNEIDEVESLKEGLFQFLVVMQYVFDDEDAVAQDLVFCVSEAINNASESIK